MRRVVGAAVGLVLGVMLTVLGMVGGAGGAVAATPPVGPTPPVATQCSSAPYPDVSTKNPFCVDIVWLTNKKIASGYADGDFHPADDVSRQAMAVFIYRYLHPDTTPAACTADPFTDVHTSDASCPEIAALKSAGVLTGYGTAFHPSASVSRQAMAAFLYKISNKTVAAACTKAPFPDVSTKNPFCGDVSWLSDKGVVAGYHDGDYHPAGTVSRQAMARFLHELYTATH